MTGTKSKNRNIIVYAKTVLKRTAEGHTSIRSKLCVPNSIVYAILTAIITATGFLIAPAEAKQLIEAVSKILIEISSWELRPAK